MNPEVVQEIGSVGWLPSAEVVTTEFYRSYLQEAYMFARYNSTDPSTQNGALIVNHQPLNDLRIGEGANHFPKGVAESNSRWERPVKYEYVEHAERNAIYDAARHGRSTAGATMYCPWFACMDCARAIIQSHITTVVGHKAIFDITPERWRGSIQRAFDMLEEAGVDTLLYEGEIGSTSPLLFNEKEWKP